MYFLHLLDIVCKVLQKIYIIYKKLADSSDNVIGKLNLVLARSSVGFRLNGK